MNFNDSSSDKPLGVKPTGRVSNDSDETPGESNLDHEAMASATRAQERQHKNENTNSSNTISSK